MNVAAIDQVLQGAMDVERTDEKTVFVLKTGGSLTMHVGSAGSAFVVREIRRVEIAQDYVGLHTADDEADVFVEPGAIYAISLQSEERAQTRRAGF